MPLKTPRPPPPPSPASRNRNTDNLNILLRLFLVAFRILDAMYDVHACDRASKDGVLVVKPGLSSFMLGHEERRQERGHEKVGWVGEWVEKQKRRKKKYSQPFLS